MDRVASIYESSSSQYQNYCVDEEGYHHMYIVHWYSTAVRIYLVISEASSLN